MTTSYSLTFLLFFFPLQKVRSIEHWNLSRLIRVLSIFRFHNGKAHLADFESRLL